MWVKLNVMNVKFANKRANTITLPREQDQPVWINSTHDTQHTILYHYRSILTEPVLISRHLRKRSGSLFLVMRLARLMAVAPASLSANWVWMLWKMVMVAFRAVVGMWRLFWFYDRVVSAHVVSSCREREKEERGKARFKFSVYGFLCERDKF